MGDFTPEAMEVQCPGCKSHFRIRPKSENLDNSTVSCPKCFADIPVESSRLPAGSPPSADLSQVDVGFSRLETRRASVFPPEKTPALTIRSLTAPTLDDDEQAAISKLERLSLGTFTEPDALQSTFSGFPGHTGDNPFQRAKTTATPLSPLLQEFIDLDQKENDDRSNKPSTLNDVYSEVTLEREAPKALHNKSASTAGPSDSNENTSTDTPKNQAHLRPTLAPGSTAKKDPPAKTAPESRQQSDEPLQSQIISKLRARLPLAQSEPVQSDATTGVISQQDSDALSGYSNAEIIEGATGILKAEAIPEEYRDWHDFPTSNDVPSLEAGSTLDIAADQKPPKTNVTPDNATTENTSDLGEKSSEPTLAKLFKRAQKRRATLGNAPPVPTQPAPRPEAATTTASNPAISVEITEDEVASILDSSTELSQSKVVLSPPSRSTIPGLQPITTRSPKPALPKSDTQPAPKPAAPFSLKEKLAITESSGTHDGLFADVPRDTDKPPHPITHDSIVVRPDRSGKTTSQSMLARLRQRRESMEIDAAIASENRGSGFIRLPTAEIQQVLGRGTYRLLIEDIVYEPVDKNGLIQLIKGGLLLGAEQIAEADGDWMPVSQHPVFDELRRRFAAEAHALLSRISNPREAEQTEPKPETPHVENLVSPIPDPTPAPAFEPFFMIPEEPNFAVLTDSEAEQDLEIPPTPSTESLFEPISEPISESISEPADDSIDDSINDTAFDSAPAKPAVNISAEKLIHEPQNDLFDDEAQPEAAPRSKKGLLALFALLIIAGAAAYVFTQTDIFKSTPPQTPEPAQAQALAPTENTEKPEEIEKEEDKTKEVVQAQKKPEEEIAKSDFDKNDFLQWQTGSKTQAESLATARKLLEQKNFKHARAIAAYGMAVFSPSNDFQELFQQSIQDDKELHTSEALEPVALFSINGIRVEDSGQNQRIILTRDGADRFIFKPSRTALRDAWRSEIAAYRLCEMILCNFEIPHTAPAQITREQWNNIAPNSTLTEQLAWETASKDNQELQFVQGALQELVPDTTPWPIEITGLWRDWLGTAPTFNALNQDFVEAHERIKNFSDGTLYQAILEQQNNITTRQLAEQVSTLILFDFLTNNWERFSGNSANYGRGTPFAQGKIISFNNGQSFQARASRRVLGRFEWTGRFSRSTVAAVRALTPELANTVLFNDPSGIERTRLDVFWNQHRQAISRIDASIERHGNDLIFPFD